MAYPHMHNYSKSSLQTSFTNSNNLCQHYESKTNRLKQIEVHRFDREFKSSKQGPLLQKGLDLSKLIPKAFSGKNVGPPRGEQHDCQQEHEHTKLHEVNFIHMKQKHMESHNLGEKKFHKCINKFQKICMVIYLYDYTRIVHDSNPQ